MGAPLRPYLPGSGANLMSRDARLRRRVQTGASCPAVSGHGYGGSDGLPIEAGLQGDVRDYAVTPIASALRLNTLLPQRHPLHIVEGRCHTPSRAQFETLVHEFVRGPMR